MMKKLERYVFVPQCFPWFTWYDTCLCQKFPLTLEGQWWQLPYYALLFIKESHFKEHNWGNETTPLSITWWKCRCARRGAEDQCSYCYFFFCFSSFILSWFHQDVVRIGYILIKKTKQNKIMVKSSCLLLNLIPQ